MSAGLAATLDASLDLRGAASIPGDQRPLGGRARGVTRSHFTGSLARERGLHWYYAPFYLTDREIAEGPTSSMSYREAVKALVYRAQELGVTSLHSTECGASWPAGPVSAEARYGRAVARATVERQWMHRWTLSFLGRSR
jgi:hypothetical protein